MYIFVCSLLMLLCTGVSLLFSRLFLLSLLSGILGLLLLAMFFLKRHEYRELMLVGQFFALEKDREEDIFATAMQEVEQIASLSFKEKTSMQSAFVSETVDALKKCLSSNKDKTSCALLEGLLLRRTGVSAPKEQLIEQWSQTVQHETDVVKRIEQTAYDTSQDSFSAASQRKRYELLRCSPAYIEQMKQGVGAWVVLDVERKEKFKDTSQDENCVCGEILDGYLRARIRFEGEDVAIGTLLLPLGGLKPGEKVTLRTPVVLPHPCDPQKTAVWIECGRLWLL